MSQIHILTIEPFQKILAQPKFAKFRRHIRIYGTWIALKVYFIELAMKRELRSLRDVADDAAGLGVGVVDAEDLDVAAISAKVDALADELDGLRQLLRRPIAKKRARRAAPEATAAPTRRGPDPPRAGRSPEEPPGCGGATAPDRRSTTSRPSLESRPSIPALAYPGYVRPPRSPGYARGEPEDAFPLFDDEIARVRRRLDVGGPQGVSSGGGSTRRDTFGGDTPPRSLERPSLLGDSPPTCDSDDDRVRASRASACHLGAPPTPRSPRPPRRTTAERARRAPSPRSESESPPVDEWVDDADLLDVDDFVDDRALLDTEFLPPPPQRAPHQTPKISKRSMTPSPEDDAARRAAVGYDASLQDNVRSVVLGEDIGGRFDDQDRPRRRGQDDRRRRGRH